MSFSYLLKISSLAILLSAIPFGDRAAQAQSLTFSDSPTNSLVTGINDLTVDGVLYDVTFQSGSFNSLFGSAANLDFTTESAARNAAQAIITVLGNTLGIAESSSMSMSDSFIVPYTVVAVPSGTGIRVAGDALGATFQDAVATTVGSSDSSATYADFALSSTAVPSPALLPSLLGFGVAAFRKRKLAQSDAD